ncbi:Titin [Chelonia mydas]|uniref:Titin n=1 Tax=Chelonia mydas TaxID=8469 RepID=M7BUZ8_CHEMY|nr:Titin [Chelonia mydas]
MHCWCCAASHCLRHAGHFPECTGQAAHRWRGRTLSPLLVGPAQRIKASNRCRLRELPCQPKHRLAPSLAGPNHAGRGRDVVQPWGWHRVRPAGLALPHCQWDLTGFVFQGLALWIPQEAAALAGDPDDPSDPPPAPAVSDPAGDSHVPAKPCSTLAEIPPAPTLTGDPNTPAEPPPLPAAPTLTGDPDTPAKPLPTLAEIPPVLTAPDRAGDPKVPVEPPPTFVDPRQGPSSQALQRPEAARPEASWELPNLVPSAPVVLPASGPGSSSWFKVGAESPLAPGDLGAAARPVVYPPTQEVPPAPAAGPQQPSLCPASLGPPQARLKRVQLVPPFQDHPWAGDAPRAQPVLKALGQNQGTSAAVGSPVGPIPADPSTGQAISPAKQLPGVAPDPLPPPDASVLATPERGWPEIGPNGDVGSPVDPLRRCSPTQLVPSAGRTQPGPWDEIPSAPLAHSPPRNTDTCIIL